MADLEDTIRENAEGPAKASGDAGSVEQHPLDEQIEADRFSRFRFYHGFVTCVVETGEEREKVSPSTI